MMTTATIFTAFRAFSPKLHKLFEVSGLRRLDLSTLIPLTSNTDLGTVAQGSQFVGTWRKLLLRTLHK